MAKKNTRSGFIKSFDGTKIYYSVEGSGPPLLFCYGLVCSKLHWHYQIDHFKKTHTVIWTDYRGHHLSETPANKQSITIENIAKDVKAVLDEIQIKNVVALGHSMGVNVVLDLYRQFPEMIDAMVLANGCARGPLESVFNNNLLQYVFPLLGAGFHLAPEITAKLWRQIGGTPLSKWLIGWAGFNPRYAKRKDIDTYVDLAVAMDLAVTLQVISNYEKYDALPWLHLINKPTLIIASESDNVIPRPAQELMHQLITRSELEVIPQGSHCPQMDLPDVVNIRIDKFLKSIKQ